MIFSREGDHVCRLVFAAVTLITIHTLCKDLATAEVSTHVGASPRSASTFTHIRAREPRPWHVNAPSGSDMHLGEVKP